MMKRRRRGMGLRRASSWTSGCGSSMLPHVGQFPLLDQPEAVARAVFEFLGADNAPQADDTAMV